MGSELKTDKFAINTELGYGLRDTTICVGVTVHGYISGGEKAAHGAQRKPWYTSHKNRTSSTAPTLS